MQECRVRPNYRTCDQTRLIVGERDEYYAQIKGKDVEALFGSGFLALLGCYPSLNIRIFRGQGTTGSMCIPR
jgi:hypothetical protein